MYFNEQHLEYPDSIVNFTRMMSNLSEKNDELKNSAPEVITLPYTEPNGYNDDNDLKRYNPRISSSRSFPVMEGNKRDISIEEIVHSWKFYCSQRGKTSKSRVYFANEDEELEISILRFKETISKCKNIKVHDWKLLNTKCKKLRSQKISVAILSLTDILAMSVEDFIKHCEQIHVSICTFPVSYMMNLRQLSFSLDLFKYNGSCITSSSEYHEGIFVSKSNVMINWDKCVW